MVENADADVKVVRDATTRANMGGVAVVAVLAEEVSIMNLLHMHHIQTLLKCKRSMLLQFMNLKRKELWLQLKVGLEWVAANADANTEQKNTGEKNAKEPENVKEPKNAENAEEEVVVN
jgi:hypothetical protein